MVASVPVSLAVGAALGFLSALGIGGGSLLMLWLTMVLGYSQADARGINLLFFIPSAAVACILHKKQGRLHIQRMLPAIVSGCVCAGIFSFLAPMLELSLLKKLFGVLLLAAGLREVTYRPKNANK